MKKELKVYACVHKKPVPKEWRNDFQAHPLYERGNDGVIFALDIFETKKDALKASKEVEHLKVIQCAIIYND